MSGCCNGGNCPQGAPSCSTRTGEGVPGPEAGGPKKGCTKEMGADGAVSWDTFSKVCIQVTGIPVIIGDTANDLEDLACIANHNMHVSAYQNAVRDNYSLPAYGDTAYA